MDTAKRGTVALPSGEWEWIYQPVIDPENRSVTSALVLLYDPSDPKNRMKVDPPFAPDQVPQEDFRKTLRHPWKRMVVDQAGDRWIFRNASRDFTPAMAADVPDIPYRATIRSPEGYRGTVELPQGTALGDPTHDELLSLAQKALSSPND